MARKGKQNHNKISTMDQSNYSSKEWQEAQNRMSQLIEQNKQLSDAIQKMKSIDPKKIERINGTE